MRDLNERRTLAASATPMDRGALEAMVDRFINHELPSPEAAGIAYAAEAFERRADGLPAPHQAVVRRFAAALRERLARLRRH